MAPITDAGVDAAALQRQLTVLTDKIVALQSGTDSKQEHVTINLVQQDKVGKYKDNKRKRRCHKCGDKDHEGKDCRVKPKYWICFRCGKKGHRSHECTAPAPINWMKLQFCTSARTTWSDI